MDSVNKLISEHHQSIIDEFVNKLNDERKVIVTLKELKELDDTIEKQKKQIKRLRDKNKVLKNEFEKLQGDNEILSSMNKELNEEYNKLKYEYKALKKNEKQVIELIEVIPKTKNERGAGRKPKFTDTDIENMKMYKIQGLSTRAIAEIFKCSHVTVNKLINEHKK